MMVRMRMRVQGWKMGLMKIKIPVNQVREIFVFRWIGKEISALQMELVKREILIWDWSILENK